MELSNWFSQPPSWIALILFIASAILNLVLFYNKKEREINKDAVDMASKATSIAKSQMEMVADYKKLIEEKTKLDAELEKAKDLEKIKELENKLAEVFMALLKTTNKFYHLWVVWMFKAELSSGLINRLNKAGRISPDEFTEWATERNKIEGMKEQALEIPLSTYTGEYNK